MARQKILCKRFPTKSGISRWKCAHWGLISLACLYPGGAGRFAGNPKPRESACFPVREQNVQLAEDHVPIVAPGMPMLYHPLGRQIQHPAQWIVIGKRRLVLSNLPELTVQALNNIRRVRIWLKLFTPIQSKQLQSDDILFSLMDSSYVLLRWDTRLFRMGHLQFSGFQQWS